jgi:hypothetical protein
MQGLRCSGTAGLDVGPEIVRSRGSGGRNRADRGPLDLSADTLVEGFIVDP